MRDFKRFGRILVPMITPFSRNDQSVDYGTARKVARYLKEHNLCDSIIVAGTTGEFHSLTKEERIRLFEEIKDEMGNELPLIAGVGAVSTKEVLEYVREAEKLGYDAVMVVAPYYCRPEQDGIFEHYATIAENTHLPVMVYNIPLFTGVNIAPETLARLAAFENIFSIKDEAALNPLQATDYMLATEGKLAVYSGDDTMVLQVLLQGGVGVVSGGSHVVGDLMRKSIDAFLAGDIETARSVFVEMYEFFKALRIRVNPTPLVKAAFELVSGFPVSTPRLPLKPATERELESLKKALKKLGKL
ncbi:4-hydroxy-tetrahydrodipicolinate synthase [Thermotoga caldifontis]|uniref:4-hydroxy-tetrahydrodipicolinate synthase n=1 Tax=Thermotoga caldifontis TaxID=1508419 RepID=UPI000596E91B|nr:4-hydroxy-tetrahydrodipicolinate synthase [Thermotoga caldifontis]